MMLHKVSGMWLRIVDLDPLPDEPIFALNPDEVQYKGTVGKVLGRLPITWLKSKFVTGTTDEYARALDHALRTGIITEPGTYGIELQPNHNYHIYPIYDK